MILGVNIPKCALVMLFSLWLSLLWTCCESSTEHRLLRQAFVPLSDDSFSFPIYWATQYAHESLLKVFSFFLSCLWAHALCDFWFGSRHLQTKQPPFSLKPDNHVKMWCKLQKCKADWHFSVITADTQTVDILFISRNLALLCSSLTPPDGFTLFSIIYTFKHEISLWAFCSRTLIAAIIKKMSLRGLVAPRLAFHFYHKQNCCEFFSSLVFFLFSFILSPVIFLSFCTIWLQRQLNLIAQGLTALFRTITLIPISFDFNDETKKVNAKVACDQK